MKGKRLKTPVSVVVIAHNESDRIERCLASVSWADEIIVIDSLSHDDTVARSLRYTTKVFLRAWPGYARQKNAGMRLASYEWVLFIDADEEVSSELAHEIQSVFLHGVGALSGFVIPRQAYYWGRPVRFGEWGQDNPLRLVKKTCAQWTEEKSVHEELCLEGDTKLLRSPLYHFTNRTIFHHLGKCCHYSWLYARDAFLQKKRFEPGMLLVGPVRRFVNGYIRLQGFRDGLRGFVIAMIQSLDIFLRYWKIFLLRAGFLRLPRRYV